MEESDSMLFTSLLEMKVKLPSTVSCLADIKSDDLQVVLTQMLQLSGSDTSSITELNKNQKFRVATKLNQELTKKFNTQFQLNDLMSSGINNIRKILVTVMSKMSMIEMDSKNNDRQYDATDNLERVPAFRRGKLVLDGWLKKQWVHPSLVQLVPTQYQGHLLEYQMGVDDFEKKNILRQARRNDVFYSLNAVLAGSYNNSLLTTRKKEEEEGLIKHQVDTFEEVRNRNINDWTECSNNQRKMAKARKRLITQVSRQVSKKDSTAPTIFQQQVQELKTQAKQKQEEKGEQSTQTSFQVDDPLGKMLLDLEQIKKNHEKALHEMTEDLDNKEKQLMGAQEDKVKMQQQIASKEEQATRLQETIQATKVEAQKVKRIIDGLNSPEGLEGEVNKLREELKQIQEQASLEVGSLKKIVKQIQRTGREKLNQISEVKLNLSRIEEDYVRITRELADNQRRKSKVQLPTHGITRAVYNKKIAENESKLRESKQEIQSLNQQIGKLQEKIQLSVSSTNRIQTQIENLLTQDSKKQEDLQKTIKDIYGKYKSIYKNTIQIMDSINEVREESREYETRLREIANKNYKETIEKLNSLK